MSAVLDLLIAEATRYARFTMKKSGFLAPVIRWRRITRLSTPSARTRCSDYSLAGGLRLWF